MSESFPTFSITYQTKGKLPSLPFERMKDAVLGKDYELSVVVCDLDLIHQLNRDRRGKDTPTDILSFPLSDTEGEIFLNLDECRRQASLFDREYENFIGFLFIHGLVHLKGLDHGSRMENEEQKFRKLFGI